MKIKEGSENNPRFKLMEEDGITLKQIEKWYGKETADALVQYCDEKKKKVNDVAETDREWNKFEMWSKRQKKHRIGTSSRKFDNWIKVSGIEKHGGNQRIGKVYDRPERSDIYSEGSGQVDEFTISNFIGEELMECEWVGEFDFDDYEPVLYLTTTDGTKFKVVVSKD